MLAHFFESGKFPMSLIDELTTVAAVVRVVTVEKLSSCV
jgi:hypothetical protein